MLELDRLEQLARGRRSLELELRLRERVDGGRIAVSGERRSCETARRSAVLTRVAAAERLGLERLALEAFAVDRDGEQRGERREEAAADVRARGSSPSGG